MQNRAAQYGGGMGVPPGRFVKVYFSHNLCRNVPSRNSCGNASGISPFYKGCGKDVYQFLNQVDECQNLAFLLWMVSLNYATV